MNDNSFKDTRDINGEYEGKVDNSLVNKAYNNAYPQKRDQYVVKKKQENNAKQDDYYQKPNCIVVDGYNLLYSIDEFADLAKTNLENARENLIELLCDYKGIIKGRLIVVFDAYNVNSQREDYIYDGINVVFTKKGKLADHYIENLVKELIEDYKITVITSDALEQALAFAHGALRMSSEEFVNTTNEKLQRAYHKALEKSSRGYKNRPLANLAKFNDIDGLDN